MTASANDSVCAVQLPKLWGSFVDNIVNFAFTGQCCATPDQAVSTTETAPEPPTSLPAAKRLVAIGDLHGDLNKTERALQLAGVADERGNWIGGDTVCVQVGDVLDRGDDEIKIFFYLEKLQQQARAAGGQLHVLNGNHEIMAASGFNRYATHGSAVELLRWHRWQAVAESLKLKCGCGGDDQAPSSSQRLLQALHDNQFGRKDTEGALRFGAFGPGGPLARRFLAPHPTVLQVGSTLFVHGGVLPHHVEYGLERINKETAEWLHSHEPRGDNGEYRASQVPRFLRGGNAVVWARDYSMADEGRCNCDKLQSVLDSIPGAGRMVVGHTIQQAGINPACAERVVRVDVGMSRGCGDGQVEVLEIVDDKQLNRLSEQQLPTLPRPPSGIPSPFWHQVMQAAAAAAKA